MLQWAFNNSEHGSFNYYHGGVYNLHNSLDLIHDILVCFRRDVGYYINDRRMSRKQSNLYGDQATDEKNANSEKQFRDKLSTEIFDLTGTKPRFAADSQGK
uniref:Uncharacterized protein n=1 Tax=Trieres chinensis TaxID=1514140 RepID=A0A7S2A325_TRICV|mmetsp:Transcript_38080/g.77701  ORF Transcript_38080/g.77701 Transcript_38080/m.77701 type:complete len:101 (+) Transcript_38080:183-485(+)